MPPLQLLGLLGAALLAGCAATPARDADVRDYFEEATGTSITYVRTPASFVHGQPGLASNGRDYVYLAPLAVSRGGERSCWLWLGIWSTVDRQARDDGASPLRLGPLQIVADGEPMDLDARAAGSNPAGLGRIPYATPVAPAQELLVRVTRTQLQRLGRARMLTLVDRPAEGAAREWQGDAHASAVLNLFAEDAGVPATSPAPVAAQ
jgi:hypothetical protein